MGSLYIRAPGDDLGAGEGVRLGAGCRGWGLGTVRVWAAEHQRVVGSEAGAGALGTAYRAGAGCWVLGVSLLGVYATTRAHDARGIMGVIVLGVVGLFGGEGLPVAVKG